MKGEFAPMNEIKSFFDHLGIMGFVRPTVGLFDLLDILLVAYIIYKIIFWVKETRAWVLFKGILVILVLAAMANVFKLNTIIWILSNTISVGIMALIVVFQPELRKFLEELGKGQYFSFVRNEQPKDTKQMQRIADEIVKAVDKMSIAKTGALILIEQDVPLGDYEKTGIPIDAIISSQILVNIFEHNTPLHDGAVIIKQNRVAAATCFLPLSDNNSISMDLGTRHRAAIGVSEVSDAVVIVVSEETGSISLAQNSQLHRDISTEKLHKLIAPNTKNNKQTTKRKLLFRKGR